jgi:hypothetical protein
MGKDPAMEPPMSSGFFAYPSFPPTVGDTIAEGVARINRSADYEIMPWVSCKTGGRIILSAITEAIRSADVFCPDVTCLNPNVMFELGYAIGRDRRLWLVLDESIPESRRNWKSLGLLATLAYSPYCNSVDLEREFYRQAPYQGTPPGFFTRELSAALDPTAEATLLFLKNAHETEANIRIGRALIESGLPITTDDPTESSGQSLLWYANTIGR